MKKHLAIIISFVIFVSSFIGVYANYQETETNHTGYEIEFNGEAINHSSVIINNTNYIPMRSVFEKMGAEVFYRSSDRQILALSRDGDTIRHIVGSNIAIVNGQQKEFENPSVLENGETYIPLEMLSVTLIPDRILYDNGR